MFSYNIMPGVRSLVQLRIDREYYAGAFVEMERFVGDNVKEDVIHASQQPVAVRVIDAIVLAAWKQASVDLDDIKGLSLDPTAKVFEVLAREASSYEERTGNQLRATYIREKLIPLLRKELDLPS